MQAVNQYIGSGIVFPLQLDSDGRVVVTTGFELIRGSILIILNWPRRHRYFNELFGARLEEVLEEPADEIGKSLVRTFITEGIRIWEPRVELLEVTIKDEEITSTQVFIELTYRIKNTKVEETFVFPFYKEIIY